MQRLPHAHEHNVSDGRKGACPFHPQSCCFGLPGGQPQGFNDLLDDLSCTQLSPAHQAASGLFNLVSCLEKHCLFEPNKPDPSEKVNCCFPPESKRLTDKLLLLLEFSRVVFTVMPF